MRFDGIYTFHVPLQEGVQKQTVVVRNNYRGYEGELRWDGGCSLLQNVHVKDEFLVAQVSLGDKELLLRISPTSGSEQQAGRIFALEDLTYEQPKRRALILYATMTKNTEKIAQAFAESFSYYNWEVTLFRLKASADWAGMQEKLYFDDYDVVCLGSPIVAGYPLTIVNKVFSLGAGGELENNVQQMVDSGKGFELNSKTAGGGPPSGKDGKKQIGARWRRRSSSYPGGPCRDNYQPLGIVFTTYGGGFYGSGESKATLAALKLFLELNNVSVVGTFACCGKEFGPAGVPEGQKPNTMGHGTLSDPVYYDTADGKQIQGSYFFHNQMWNHPNQRDLNKAKYLVADLVEDYFLTSDGQRGFVNSEYISIS